jgi:hypothetical protein
VVKKPAAKKARGRGKKDDDDDNDDDWKKKGKKGKKAAPAARKKAEEDSDDDTPLFGRAPAPPPAAAATAEPEEKLSREEAELKRHSDQLFAIRQRLRGVSTTALKQALEANGADPRGGDVALQVALPRARTPPLPFPSPLPPPSLPSTRPAPFIGTALSLSLSLSLSLPLPLFLSLCLSLPLSRCSFATTPRIRRPASVPMPHLASSARRGACGASTGRMRACVRAIVSAMGPMAGPASESHRPVPRDCIPDTDNGPAAAAA